MILRRTAAYLWPYRWRVGLALVQVALISAFELLKPWPLQIVIDSVLGGRPAAWSRLSGLPPTTLLGVAAVGLVLIYVVLGAIAVWNNYTTISIGQGMVNDLRSRFYDHLQRVSLLFHARAGVGDLIYRVTADTYAIQTLAMNGLFPILSALLLLAGMLVVMIRLDPLLTAVACSVGPLLLAGIVLVNRHITAAATEMRERESEVYQIVQRNLSAIKVVQAFSREGVEHRRFVAGSRASLRSGLRLYTLQTAYGAATNVLIAGGTAAVLWIGAQQVWSGRLSVGELIVFVSYLASLYAPINSIVQTYGLIQGAKAGVVRVFDILDAEPAAATATRRFRLRCAARSRSSTSASPIRAEARCADRSAHRRRRMRRHRRADRRRKSTLVSLIPRFYGPVEGQVLIDGVDVRPCAAKTAPPGQHGSCSRRSSFPSASTTTSPHGRPEATREEVEAAAKIAQAHDFIALAGWVRYGDRRAGLTPRRRAAT
jgi:ATP-binding cassette subfamily B protein/subfamily B ATP-binding cassette protein MsbA